MKINGKNFNTGALGVLCALIIFLASGCAGPLEIAYNPKHTTQEVKAKVPVSILVQPFADARDLSKTAFTDPRTIGTLDAPVSDMTGNKITLAEDVASLVTKAYMKELTLAGYIVKTPEDKEGADFILTGEVREFSASVGARDEIAIALSSVIKEAETGMTLWSGNMVEKGDRYAGVMGNSRLSLSNYIAGSLSKAIRSSLAEVGPKIANTRAAYAPGQAKAQDRVVTPSTDAPAPAGTGRIVITTDPPRAKVYLGDVYYGLTPLSIDLDPGVYEFIVKQRGFKPASEKVSVRGGQFTELEMEMNKE